MDKIEYEKLIVISRLKDYIHKTAFNLISDIQKKVKKDNLHNTAADRNKLVYYALPIIENYFLMIMNIIMILLELKLYVMKVSIR